MSFCCRFSAAAARRLPLATTTPTILTRISPSSLGVRALAARAPVRCSAPRAHATPIPLTTPTTSTTVDRMPFLDSHQDASVTYPARLHGRGIFKKPLFATRRLHGHLAPPESLVSILDPAPSHTAHPPSPFPPNEKPFLDSHHQDASVTYPARLHGRGISKKPLFATRRLHGHLAPPESLVSIFDPAPSHTAHPPSPFPPNEKPFLDSHQDASVTYPARLHGRGILKKPLFATRRLHGHLAPPESLVSILDPAPSHTAHPPSPFPPNEKPFLDSHQDASVTYPARLHGRGILKKPLFATRRLHGHLAPLEPLAALSEANTRHPLATSPLASLQVLDLELRL